MCLLLETIKLENGLFCHLKWHEERINTSRKALLNIAEPLQLNLSMPELCNRGIYKCRIVYADTIKNIEFQEYSPRKITSLRLIEHNTIDYAFKYADRHVFSSLPKQMPDAEWLIVKNGCLTDTTFSNIVLYDGHQWYTPTTYLLNGTQRQRLLHEGRIVESAIRPIDLLQFKSIRLINSMLDFESSPDIEIQNIIPLNK